MKHTILYLSTVGALFLCGACEQEMEVYHAEGNDRLNFHYENIYEPDTLIKQTFIYLPEDQMTDTIWFDIKTSGYVTDYPRAVNLEQVEVEGQNAVPDKHYVAFDNPLLKDAYVIPANAAEARIPLIVKKDDPALSSTIFSLKIRIKENKYFKPGFPGYQERTVTISNVLQKPDSWTMYADVYFAGSYGPEKHKFMIRVTEKMGITLDDDFFKDMVGDPSKVDMGYTNYWRTVFMNALEEENAARAERGEGPLQEGPEYDNVLVDFSDPRG